MPEKSDLDPAGELRKLRLFANLTANELQSLAPLLELRQYQRGEFIFHMGEEAKRLYLLERGAIKINRASPTGNERVLYLHTPGDVFGWLYVTRSDRWAVAAQALPGATVRTIAEEAFTRLMRTIPAFALNVVGNLLDQHCRMLVRVEALAHPEPGPGLIATLVDLAEHLGDRIGDRYTLPGFLTQGDLASMVGLNRSTISLLINQYRRRGILGGQRGVLVVHCTHAKALLKDAGVVFG